MRAHGSHSGPKGNDWKPGEQSQRRSPSREAMPHVFNEEEGKFEQALGSWESALAQLRGGIPAPRTPWMGTPGPSPIIGDCPHDG